MPEESSDGTIQPSPIFSGRHWHWQLLADLIDVKVAPHDWLPELPLADSASSAKLSPFVYHDFSHTVCISLEYTAKFLFSVQPKTRTFRCE
jgi:hypothetical protein